MRKFPREFPQGMRARFLIHAFAAKPREQSSLGNALMRGERLLEQRLLLRIERQLERGSSSLVAHLVPTFAQGIYDLFR